MRRIVGAIMASAPRARRGSAPRDDVRTSIRLCVAAMATWWMYDRGGQRRLSAGERVDGDVVSDPLRVIAAGFEGVRVRKRRTHFGLLGDIERPGGKGVNVHLGRGIVSTGPDRRQAPRGRAPKAKGGLAQREGREPKIPPSEIRDGARSSQPAFEHRQGVVFHLHNEYGNVAICTSCAVLVEIVDRRGREKEQARAYDRPQGGVECMPWQSLVSRTGVPVPMSS